MIERRAHAKINLDLRILGRRPDGFHQLETLMVPLDLHDRIQFKPSPELSLTVDGAKLPTGPDNLAMRAALLLKERAGYPGGAQLHLIKNIPHGGGLAGGSSDAACVLRGLNELWQTGLDPHHLAELGARLGSDVNFFLQDGPAICRGRGEQVEPVELEPLPRVLLVNPGWGVSTPWAYQTYAAKPGRGRPGRARFLVRHADGSREERIPVNDLETAVFQKHLWIRAAKEWLLEQDGVWDAMMSGSGATVFALLLDGADASALLAKAQIELGPDTNMIETRLGGRPRG